MVKVKYGVDAVGFAQRLLAASEDKKSVVFSPDGFFEVPEDTAEKAGVSYDVEQDEPEAPSEAPEADVDPEVASEPTEDAEEPEEEDSVDPHNLRGKPLNEALEAEGLSTDGKLAEKQARLAEALDKE